jgi:hypothetical protein
MATEPDAAAWDDDAGAAELDLLVLLAHPAITSAAANSPIRRLAAVLLPVTLTMILLSS